MDFLTLNMLAMLLAWFHVGIRADDANISAPRNRLHALKDLKLRGKITKYKREHSGQLPAMAMDVDEHHSNELKMSHFVYRRQADEFDQEQSDEFYTIDSERLLQVNRFNWTCERKTHHEMLLDRVFRTDSPDSWLVLAIFSSSFGYLSPKYAKPAKHVTGLARLLYLFDLNRDKMQPLEVQLYVESQLTDLYKLDMQFARQIDSDEFEVAKLHAYFPQDTPLNLNESPFPRRVTLQVGLETHMMIDFLLMSPMSREEIFPDTHDYHLDEFTIDPRFGCAPLLGPQSSINTLRVSPLLSMHYEEVDMFALQREGSRASSANSRQFVAYDGRQSVFRRDNLRETGASPNGGASEYTITIHDLKRELKYNVKGGRCLAAQTTRSLYEPVFPFVGFAHLGTGRVRGVEVDVYEHQTCGHLPAVLYPHSHYISSNAKLAASDNNEQLIRDEDGQRDRTLSVVYYFARTTQELGPLMRVDVYLEGKGEHVGQIEVFKFAWGLQQAPNGDNPDQLFVLPNECVLAKQNAIDIRMQLEFRKVQTSGEPISGKELGQLLSSRPQVRNKMFKTSIAVQTSLSITQIDQFQTDSRLVEAGNSTQLHAYIAFRLIQVSRHIEMDLFQPADVVYASPRLGTPPTGASNFEECFFEAAHQRLKTGPVLFAFHSGSCLLDSKPVYEIDKTTNRLIYTYSSAFIIHRNGSSIERRATRAKEILIEKARPAVMARALDDQLRGHLLSVPLAIDNQIQPQTVAFEVTHVEVTERSVPNGELANSFEGLTLTSGKLVKFTASGGTSASLANCHSACLSDLNCWSFSICTRELEVQCLLSELDLRESHLLRRIKNGQNDNTSRLLDGKLSADRRCQIYVKKPIELFSQWPEKQLVTLNTRSMSHVRDLDHCAHKCLQLNSANLQLGKIKRKQQGTSLRPSDQRNLHVAHIQKWCTRFEYIELKELATMIPLQHMVEFLSMLNVKDTKQREGGVCLLNNGPEEAPRGQQVFKANVNPYEFNFEYLFERQAGIRMVEFASNETTSTCKKVINRRKFIQTSSVDVCARACFMQTGELVPECKSFDFIRVKSEIRGPYGDSTIEFGEQQYKWKQFTSLETCALNSMTLTEARDSGHYDEIVLSNSPNEHHNSWHYELREAYSFDDDLVQENYLLGDDLEAGLKSITIMASSTLANLLIVLAAITSGYIIAIGSRKHLNTILSFSSTRRESGFNLDPKNEE